MSKHTMTVRWFAAALTAAAALSCGAPNRGERDLQVTSFSPSDGGGDAQARITITFDHPVIGEAEVGTPLAVPPVDLEPAATVRA
ncbi:MAG TPA: hypothetical protein VL172_12310, partial [Kofleriaceae bacterium]|nr:hypothetical protein [Kofleriaceae bacterium]